MKRKLAVALVSILSLAISPLASAGQAPNYSGYNQNAYNPGGYVQTAPWGDRGYSGDRQSYRRGWNDHDDRRDRAYRNDYYGDNRYDGGGYYDRGYYDGGYYDRYHHDGRSVAIIGGSAAAGAVIGAAADQGRGGRDWRFNRRRGRNHCRPSRPAS